MTVGLLAQRLILLPGLKSSTADLGYLGLGPFAVAVVLRVLVLPRMTIRRKAFPFFVVGLAMAEACGLLGLILGGASRETYFTLSLATLLAYAPLFARHYDRPAATSPFHTPSV